MSPFSPNSQRHSIPNPSRLNHLIPLLPPLQPLNSLLVHRLGHLLIPLALGLGLALLLDLLYSLLVRVSPARQVSLQHTTRAASFSSFISFSFALTASMATFSTWRFAKELLPALGRNAFLGSCHCMPGNVRLVRVTGRLLAILAHALGLGKCRRRRNRSRR